MFRRLPLTWLPRVLSWLAFGVSFLLIVLVILSPLVDNGEAAPAGWGRVLALFARDGALRRTALACALGLTVTACIFFRPARATPPPRRRRKGPRVPPPPSVAGA